MGAAVTVPSITNEFKYNIIKGLLPAEIYYAAVAFNREGLASKKI